MQALARNAAKLRRIPATTRLPLECRPAMPSTSAIHTVSEANHRARRKDIKAELKFEGTAVRTPFEPRTMMADYLGVISEDFPVALRDVQGKIVGVMNKSQVS